MRPMARKPSKVSGIAGMNLIYGDSFVMKSGNEISSRQVRIEVAVCKHHDDDYQERMADVGCESGDCCVLCILVQIGDKAIRECGEHIGLRIMADKAADEDNRRANQHKPFSALPKTVETNVTSGPTGAVYRAPGDASIHQAGMGVAEKQRRGGIMGKSMAKTMTKKGTQGEERGTPIIRYALRIQPLRIPIHHPIRKRNISIVFGEGAYKTKTFCRRAVRTRQAIIARRRRGRRLIAATMAIGSRVTGGRVGTS